jgi:methylated-DNA-[protein]-cysteine S-methyltransferase
LTVVLGIAEVAAPFGPVTVAASAAGVCAVVIGCRPGEARAGLERRFGEVSLEPGGAAATAAGRLEEFLAGSWRALDDLSTDAGGTDFDGLVWRELRRIPPGATLSYGELALRLGRPRAVRAVAGANGRNPVPVIVPCHRVIGADGRLTGYGGGLAVKEWLLRHEAAAPGAGVLRAVRPRPARSGPARRLPFEG